MSFWDSRDEGAPFCFVLGKSWRLGPAVSDSRPSGNPASGDPVCASYGLAPVNPEIIPMGDEVAEGCEGWLSIPEIRGRVPRARDIKVKALTPYRSRFLSWLRSACSRSNSTAE
jgi:hypothetical protein